MTVNRSTVWIYGILLGLTGCSHKSPSPSAVIPADFLSAQSTQQITFSPESDHPRFSDDSSLLLYQSRRDTHRGWQLYEMDLSKIRERRVTFSDGDAFDAIYLNSNDILYASTTDEIKESPLQNKNFAKEAPPSELYMSDRYGNEIVRLTRQPGYEGEAILWDHPQKPTFIFTSKRSDLFGVYRMDLHSQQIHLISAEKNKEKRFPSLSPDKTHLAWVERDLQNKTDSVILLKLQGKIPLAIKQEDGVYRDLFFAPQPPARLFYSVTRTREKNAQIEVYDLEKQCTQVVLKGSDSFAATAVSRGT
ncbi:MAG: hypothetical protein AAGB31_07700, partial [Bdellovibrio sp.]